MVHCSSNTEQVVLQLAAHTVYHCAALIQPENKILKLPVAEDNLILCPSTSKQFQEWRNQETKLNEKVPLAHSSWAASSHFIFFQS